MPQVTDYASLVSTVGSYHERSTSTDFMAQVDTFIGLAESNFNRRLKSREMVTTTTLTTDADGYATLPADFIRARGFHTINGNLSQTLSVIAQPAIADLFPIDTGGIATYVSISNGQIRIQTTAQSDVVLEYDARFVGLSSLNATNWIMSRHPDLYLFATLAQGSVYLKDYQEAAVLSAQASTIADELDALYGMELYNNAGVTLTEVTP